MEPSSSGYNHFVEDENGVQVVHSFKREVVMKLANIKRANKDTKLYVGRSTTVHIFLFCAHTLHELRYQSVSYGGPWVSLHNQISHGTTKHLTARPNNSRHNQISHGTTKNSHGTTKYFTAQPQPNMSRHNQKLSRHNQTSHGTTKHLTAQPKTLTAQPNISRHNQISHGTTKNSHGKIK